MFNRNNGRRFDPVNSNLRRHANAFWDKKLKMLKEYKSRFKTVITKPNTDGGVHRSANCNTPTFNSHRFVASHISKTKNIQHRYNNVYDHPRVVFTILYEQCDLRVPLQYTIDTVKRLFGITVDKTIIEGIIRNDQDKIPTTVMIFDGNSDTTYEFMFVRRHLYLIEGKVYRFLGRFEKPTSGCRPSDLRVVMDDGSIVEHSVNFGHAYVSSNGKFIVVPSSSGRPYDPKDFVGMPIKRLGKSRVESNTEVIVPDSRNSSCNNFGTDGFYGVLGDDIGNSSNY